VIVREQRLAHYMSLRGSWSERRTALRARGGVGVAIVEEPGHARPVEAPLGTERIDADTVHVLRSVGLLSRMETGIVVHPNVIVDVLPFIEFDGSLNGCADLRGRQAVVVPRDQGHVTKTPHVFFPRDQRIRLLPARNRVALERR